MRRARPIAALAVVLAAVGSAAVGPVGPASAVPTASGSTADLVRENEYWLDDYGIRDAWQTTRGAGVTIAIIDTGVGDPPDLQGAIAGGADFSGEGSSDGRTPVGSDPEHGTLVASLAVGRGTGPGSGVIGSAPEARVLAISIGFGGGDSDAQIADAVRWAVDNGADIISMSLTRNTLDWPPSWDEAFLYAMRNDVVVLAAAGNRGSGTTEVGAPATMPGVLTVAGVDREGRASDLASTQGVTIGVAAPSEDLVGVMPDGSYVRWNGTSGATPIVAGVVALVRAAHPELDAANVIQRLVATARDAGDPGPDVAYGFGILDAEAAVTASVPRVDENPMGDLAEWIRVNRRQDAEGAGIAPGPAPVERSVPEDSFDPIGVLLPSPLLLSQVGAPLLGAALVVFVVAGVAWGAIGPYRRRSRRR
ncbi:S8 family serine peptidase [Homoserinibacter sp. GY 40078]|uniref:S8 family serine peptidase n=1 Tax=Homoserinibacter sp. GY 40078 TaxID=2603275 RepID=UPI0011C8379A|nr:S8 family serine peptidase [Homoserinibacter sp. GY 40078]TXK19541.1 S8 family serine peptidase [Homoserinibacter sp. GY 40078]